MNRAILGTVIAVAITGCTQASRPVVDRGVFGCPSGYVEHPIDPKQCVLPAMAAKFYASLAPQPEPAVIVDPYQVPQQPDATVRAIEEQTYAIKVQQAEQVNADLAARRAADEARNRY